MLKWYGICLTSLIISRKGTDNEAANDDFIRKFSMLVNRESLISLTKYHLIYHSYVFPYLSTNLF